MSLFTRRSARGSLQRSYLRRLSFDRLEARRLMAGDSLNDPASAGEAAMMPPPLIDYADGVITINGTHEMDEVTFELTSSNPNGIGFAQYKVTHEIMGTWGDETVENFGIGSVNKIVFYGNGNTDIFHNNTGIPSEAYGGDGYDYLYGGSGDDVLKGEDGRDTLEGGDGNDELRGGDDKDTLSGGEGRDEMYGGPGRDTLEGGEGRDDMHGGDDKDTLVGGPAIDNMFGDGGDDTLEGNDGDDEMHGGEGDDDLSGGVGADTLIGDAGDDLLEGGDDGDTLEGREDDDRLYGGDDVDTLMGGNGHDSLWGGNNVDSLTGGLGADRYLIEETKDAGDDITNKTADDVEVFFENDENVHQSGVDYTDEAWGYDDVIEVDEALKQLVDRTQNNTLLRTKNGTELTFLRTGSALDPNDPDVFAGLNLDGSGKIWLSNHAFVEWNDVTQGVEASDHRISDDDWVHNVVLHEIGHNWEDEHSDWGDWKDISGWHQWAGVGAWNFDNGPFASTYAMSNPRDDFAETFAAYFAFENDEIFRPGSEPGINVDSPDDIQEKIDHIDRLLDELSS
jgi:hypothetical protein